jgi:hypothetical protein
MKANSDTYRKECERLIVDHLRDIADTFELPQEFVEEATTAIDAALDNHWNEEATNV